MRAGCLLLCLYFITPVRAIVTLPVLRRHSAIKAVVIGFVMTFFPIFDVPVFWPILLLYWFVLFFVTMKRQIKHMIKYRYIPFTTGKKARPCVLFPGP